MAINYIASRVGRCNMLVSIEQPDGFKEFPSLNIGSPFSPRVHRARNDIQAGL